MIETKKTRNTSIELLRIFAGMSVIVLHFNYLGSSGILAMAKGATFMVCMFLEVVCVCAVNVFILISGYFSSNSERINFGKLLSIIIQTSAFSLGFMILHCITHKSLNIKELLLSCLPMNYYVILYTALMIIAPYVNRMLKTFNTKKTKAFILTVFCLFSIYPTIIDTFEFILGRELNGLSSISLKGSLGGYSIVNFVLVYLIGAYIRKIDIETVSIHKLITIFTICVIAICIQRVFAESTAFMYSNPFVIIESATIFIIFLKIKLNNNFVNMIAPASFTCFLIQGNILSFIGLELFYDKGLCDVMVGLVFVVLGIYGVSFVLMKVWDFITASLFRATIYKIPIIDLEAEE